MLTPVEVGLYVAAQAEPQSSATWSANLRMT